jgi:hypothetical protein
MKIMAVSFPETLVNVYGAKHGAISQDIILFFDSVERTSNPK